MDWIEFAPYAIRPKSGLMSLQAGLDSLKGLRDNVLKIERSRLRLRSKRIVAKDPYFEAYLLYFASLLE
jgi:hypothetical protein